MTEQDPVADGIANAERDAKAGDYHAAAAKFAFVCTQLWERARAAESKADLLAKRVEKLERDGGTW